MMPERASWRARAAAGPSLGINLKAINLHPSYNGRSGSFPDSAFDMADPLYLSLWFPDFTGPAMVPHMNAVLQQFPFSEQRPGITYLEVQPVSWNEASILERRFSPGVSPGEAMVVAADLIHDDYAYVLEAYWDLWTPDESGREWRLL